MSRKPLLVCFCVVVWVLLSVFCISSLDDCMHPQHQETTIILRFFSICFTIKACLHGGGGPQIGEVICGWSPHLSCKRDKIKMRDYVDRRVTHQSELPHLPGVPYLHVNRPLVGQRMLFIGIKDFVIIYRCSLYWVANIVEAFFLHFFFLVLHANVWNNPFYSNKWKQRWSWPCFLDTDRSAFLCKSCCSYA